MTPRAYRDGFRNEPETYFYPRTIQQAFGKGTSRRVEPMEDEDTYLHDAIVIWGCVAAAFLAGILVLTGVIN